MIYVDLDVDHSIAKLCSFGSSYCAKTPLPTHLSDELYVLSVYLCISIPCLVAELCTHIVILVKQTRIEARATVYEVKKNNQLVSRQRHQRNVVSAFGHFVSFLLNLAHILLMIPAGYDLERNYYALFAFFTPSFNFFLAPLIETVCTESLRKSLFNLELCRSFGEVLRESRLWRRPATRLRSEIELELHFISD